ncbi:hypothetical protein SARC_08947 [Sphaeroforma arctica JP610]|uniref:Uncharacterized protein n=1 Tax=Sphaeroforma arctica JP610 TaxID=667725 RepID=A0A0L0FPA5_9EUKA|nr:hypothetical protein SARC_08947 [Sphaeroforma arctica JP610]KNC78627.1 hypothetical protein SARC_08947 [Sphaeroforma arctica JP610]|eukprot:XP_014152529.1 hypothetical protein SARC_08947 [Sphaeroforma arctica JP610]
MFASRIRTLAARGGFVSGACAKKRPHSALQANNFRNRDIAPIAACALTIQTAKCTTNTPNKESESNSVERAEEKLDEIVHGVLNITHNHCFTHGHTIVNTAISQALDICQLKHTLVAGFRVRSWTPQDGSPPHHEAKAHTWICDHLGRVLDLNCDFMPFVKTSVTADTDLSSPEAFAAFMNSKRSEWNDDSVDEVLSYTGVPPVGCVTAKGVIATVPEGAERIGDDCVGIDKFLGLGCGRFSCHYYPKSVSNGEGEVVLPDLPGLVVVPGQPSVDSLESVLLSREMYKRLLSPEVKLRIFEPISNLGKAPTTK